MRYVALLLFLFVVGFHTPTHAQPVYNSCATFSGSDVTIVTTAETVVATSEACRLPGRNVKLVIHGYAVVTTSADSATVKVRIRRATVTGTALGDAIAETVKVTAGGVEPFTIDVTDELGPTIASQVYVMTLEIASASANSTVGQAFIRVDVL